MIKIITLLSFFVILGHLAFSQMPPGHDNFRRDFHPNRGRGYSNVAVYTVIGGVGCLLAPGLQFSSGVGFGVTSYSSGGADAFFIAAGVVLIGISVALLIANQRNNRDASLISPLLKYEKHPLLIKGLAHSPGFPAIGVKVALK
jgi:hypothetical protein